MTPRPINPNDLLVRREVVIDRASVARLLHGRTVMVTGGGGFIGSELVRQCHAHGAKVLALDHSEPGIWDLRYIATPVLCDVRDTATMRDVMHTFKPAVVFHAAALKQVPLVEGFEREASKTNVVGTINCVQFAERAGVEAVVLVSTDKAVEPVSVMGKAKAAAEVVIHGADTADGARCRYTSVRFGNVMGSTGSVIPLFQQQIAAGGPVTVTHEDMTRWFMTVGEAVELTLQAAALAMERNRRGEIYVLDMGCPLRIMDVARDMVRLSGTECEIVVTGMRPGERLDEVLTWPHEHVEATSCAGVWGVMG